LENTKRGVHMKWINIVTDLNNPNNIKKHPQSEGIW
jgi:hypothetical protein